MTRQAAVDARTLFMPVLFAAFMASVAVSVPSRAQVSSGKTSGTEKESSGAAVVQSDVPRDLYAQKLADEFTAKYVRLISIGIHAKALNGSDYMIIGHTLRKANNPIPERVGRKSEEEDLQVIRTGKPDGPNDLGGGIFDVIVPLLDGPGRTIGAVVMHIKPGSPEPRAEALKLAFRFRDELRKRIPSESKLFEPAP